MSPEQPDQTADGTPADQPAEMTPEELRRQMKMRFDAVNVSEQSHRQRRQDSGSSQDAGAARNAQENKG